MALYTHHITEQRLTSRLVSAWEKLKADNEMPEYTRLNKDVIADVIVNCCIVSVNGQGKPIYKYEYVGDAVVQAYGKNPSGEYHHSSVRMPASALCIRMDQVIIERKPLFDDGQFINENNKVVKYRGCLLPYKNPANEVSHILIGLSWRAF
jgi:hypothetical protein